MHIDTRRRYGGAVQALIVDLAGPVVDFGSCGPAGAFIELFARHNVPITQAQAREPMGLHKKDHIRKIASMTEVLQTWEKVHGTAWTEGDIDALYQEFIPLQVECLPQYSDLIPGALETIDELRGRGIKIGANTGYSTEMMDVVLKCAAKQGFAPDSAVCASDVPAGRPAPWMIFRSMEQLDVYPPEAVVTVGDTIPDIEAGLNAGVWTIGLVKTGNMLGLSEQELRALPKKELKARMHAARDEMHASGAHFVADSISDCITIIDRIDSRLASGQRS